MTLQSSGQIAFSNLQSEFPGIQNYIANYTADNTDPYQGTVKTTQSNMEFNDYWGTSRRTARMRSGLSSTSYTSGYNYRRIGWAVTNGADEWHAESGSSSSAHGFATRRNYMSTTANLGGIHYFAYGNGHRHITISHASSSNSGWTFCDFKVPTYNNGPLVTRTIRRASNSGLSGGGYYRGFKRQNSPGSYNPARRSYYHWSYTYQSNQSTGTLGVIGNGLTFSYLYGRDFFVRFR